MLTFRSLKPTVLISLKDVLPYPSCPDGEWITLRVAPLNEVGQKIEAIPRDTTAKEDETEEGGEDSEERAVFEQFMKVLKEEKNSGKDENKST